MKFSKEIQLELLYFGWFALKALILIFEAILPFPCFHSKIILICSKDYLLIFLWCLSRSPFKDFLFSDSLHYFSISTILFLCCSAIKFICYYFIFDDHDLLVLDFDLNQLSVACLSGSLTFLVGLSLHL